MTDGVESVGDVPVCPGCGLAAHIEHGDVCWECWDRRNAWQGGGSPRVVARDPDADVHETPECPDFEADTWFLWPDEEACYHTLSSKNDSEYCRSCKSYRLFGEFNVLEDEQLVTDGGEEVSRVIQFKCEYGHAFERPETDGHQTPEGYTLHIYCPDCGCTVECEVIARGA